MILRGKMIGRLRRNHIRDKLRDLMANSAVSTDDIVPGVKYIRDPEQKLPVRVIWGIIVLTCSTLSLYQIFDRIGYFFDYPVKIDVQFGVTSGENSARFSEVTVCSSDTKAIGEMRLKFGFDTFNRDPLDRYCLKDIKRLWSESGKTMDEWWRQINTSEVVVKKELELVNGTILTNAISESETPLPFGLCTTLRHGKQLNMLSAKMTIEKAPHTCRMSRFLVTVQQKYDPAILSKILSFGSYQYTEVTVMQKLYYFIDTPSNPCSTIDKFGKCYRNCLVKKIMNNRKILCRFPFVPEEIVLPTCHSSSNGTDTVFKELNFIFLNTNPVGDCGCPRLCIQLANKYYGDSFPLLNSTVIKATFVPDTSTFLASRGYESVALFCDIGGNLGLFLGLSVLSIVQILHSSVQHARRRFGDRNSLDVVYVKAKKLYRSIVRSRAESMPSTSSWKRYFSFQTSIILVWGRLLAQMVLLCCCAYLIYNRTAYCLQNPTRTVVELVQTKTMLFPDVVICGVSNDNLDSMQQLSEISSTLKKCEITLLDFMDHFGADFLWKNSSILHQFLSLGTENAESFFGLPLVVAKIDEILLPEGSCARFSAGEQNFIGTLTMLNILGRFSSECRNYQTMYIYYPAQNDFDIRLGYDVPMMVQSATILELKQIERLSVPHRLCVDPAITAKCKRDCLERKLERSITCKLPYMSPNINVSTCTATESGKLTDASYKNIYARTDPFADPDCRCKLPCSENILNVIVVCEPYRGPDININSVFFVTNFYEKFVEMSNYGFVKLACDIGGMLGIALGLSIVSLMDIVHRAILSLNAEGKK